MECHVCLEAFDSAERRPKVLPCGHSFCLKCLEQLPSKECPLDKKVFQTRPQLLPDNFLVLQMCNKPAETSLPQLWCRQCKRVASQLCVDEHSICGLKKARAEEAAPLQEWVRQEEAALAELAAVADAAIPALQQQWRDELQRKQAGLAAARGRLEDALGAGEAAWERARDGVHAGGAGLARTAAQLVADLADPAASCSVTVRRGDDVAWRGQVRPADDAAARLLLCRLACGGALQPGQRTEQPQQPEQRTDAPRWQERSNEYDREMTVEEMAAAMAVGCRVARGRDWKQNWTYDGTPPGPGTVIRVGGGTVVVMWDRTGETYEDEMGKNGYYRLRLLTAAPLNHLEAPSRPQERVDYLDVQPLSVRSDLAGMSHLLAMRSLAQVRTLVSVPCAAFAPWSEMLLQRVAPLLEGLQLESPQQRHLAVVAAMPRLQALCLRDVTAPQLQAAVRVASLRRLEVHCPWDAPLPALALPAITIPATAASARLQWLRCGVHPLAAALALARAHAASLRELQLVAASTEPYGCPDLARELRHCGLRHLQRLVLLRHTGNGAFCRHDKDSCKVQKGQLWNVFLEDNLTVLMVCSVCDASEFKQAVAP